MEEMRLQKYLAVCGVASRRGAEALISEGRVSVNGQVITEMGVKITGNEKILVDGKPVKPEKHKIYIMLYKPKSVLSSVRDDRDRKCVVDLIEGVDERLYPVGRLDYDTTGLIILTNDGDFMQHLTHPSYEIWKTYEAVVRGTPTENNVRSFADGLELDDGPTLPALLTVVGYKGKNAIAEVRIREGRNRQVRRMLEKIGHPVLELKRISYGNLELGELRPGQWRYLRPEEVESLCPELSGEKR